MKVRCPHCKRPIDAGTPVIAAEAIAADIAVVQTRGGHGCLGREHRMKAPLRQGDILLVPVEAVPDGLKKVPREKGRIVLAEGEETGHLHAIEAPKPAAEFLATDLDSIVGRFLVVNGEGAQSIDAWKCRDAQGGTCWIPADTDRERVEERFTILGREMVTGVALRHDEHLPFVVTPGVHEVRRQREYSEAGGIRVVAD